MFRRTTPEPDKYCDEIDTITDNRLNPDLAVSNDGKKMAIVILGPDSGSTLYITNIDGENAKQIYTSISDHIRFPSFSESGDTLIFAIVNFFYIIDLLNNEVTKIRCRKRIRNVAYSNDLKTIYLTMASAEIGYKPYVHGFDVYSVNVNDKIVKQITQLNSYAIYAITLSNDERNLYISTHIVTPNDLIYEIQKLNIALNRITESFIPSSSNPKGGPFRFLQFSKNDNIIYYVESIKENQSTYFTGELFKLDVISKEVKKISNLGKYIYYPFDVKSDSRIYFLLDENWPCRLISSFVIMYYDQNNQNYGKIQIDKIDSLSKITVENIKY